MFLIEPVRKPLVLHFGHGEGAGSRDEAKPKLLGKIDKGSNVELRSGSPCEV